MANEYLVNSADLTAVADAIRSKGDTSEPLVFPGEFVGAIAAIQVGGSSGSGDTIGTPVFGNLMGNMIHAITSGDAVNGKFIFATAIPNTEVLIFDSGLETIHGFAVVNIDWDGTTETIQRTAFGMALMNPDAAYTEYINNTQTPFLYQYAYSMNLSTGGVNAESYSNYSSPLQQCESIRIDGGALYAKGRYNSNPNYTPFAPGMEYLWIAW